MMNWNIVGYFQDLPDCVSSHSISLSGHNMDTVTFLHVCSLLELLSDGKISQDDLVAFVEEVR